MFQISKDSFIYPFSTCSFVPLPMTIPSINLLFSLPLLLFPPSCISSLFSNLLIFTYCRFAQPSDDILSYFLSCTINFELLEYLCLTYISSCLPNTFFKSFIFPAYTRVSCVWIQSFTSVNYVFQNLLLLGPNSKIIWTMSEETLITSDHWSCT